METYNNYLRSIVIVLLFCMLYCVVGINLYFIQIKQSLFFKTLGEKQYNITMQSYPERALIFDRNQNILALNKDSISAFLLPKSLEERNKVSNFLQEYFPNAHQRFESSTDKNFMFIKRNLSDEEHRFIDQQDLKDIHLLKESSRFYPYESLGQIIGITDIDNQGLFGIEQQCNNLLQGTPTTYSLKKDAKMKHFYFSKQTTIEGTKPEPVTLTIDADLQFKFQKIITDTVMACDAKEAGAVALDPDTGEIVAMVSYPTFDPNNTKDLVLETTKNRPISQSFETGSVIKVFAALAALEEQVTNADEIIDCENTKETKLDNIRIRTVVPHGQIPFRDVMKFSNNIGIVKVAKRLGFDLYDYYKLLGFGELTGSNIPGEQKGFVNHPNNWSAYSIQSLSYGYEIRTTLLQLARAFAMIMNGGHLVTPTIIKSEKIIKKGPFIAQSTIQELQQILEETVQSGTGRRAKVEGYKILGKTGTSNLLEDGIYDANKHLYTFIGALDCNGHKRVIATYVKESKKVSYASLVVAPLFRKLAETILIHDKVFHSS